MYFFFSNFEMPNILFGGCQNAIGGCESNYDCSNHSSLQDMTFFVIFLKKTSENVISICFIQILKFPTLNLEAVSKHSGLRIWPLIMTPQIFLFFEI